VSGPNRGEGAVPEGIQPPHNLTAELAVLSAMALDDTGGAADEARGILQTPDAFFLQANKFICQSVWDLRDRSQAVDILTLAYDLEAKNKWGQVGSEHLTKVLYGSPDVGHLGEHARIVRDLYRLRRVISEGRRAEAEALGLSAADPAAIQTFLGETETRFSELAHAGMPSALRPISDVLQDTWQSINAAHQQGSAVTGVSTGFTRLDSVTAGFHDGDLIIIAGRPSQGKTALALALARRIAESGYAVPVFSYEMPADQLARRLLATEAKLDLRRINSGRIQPAEWPLLANAMASLSKLPLFIDDTAESTVLDIRAAVAKLDTQIRNGKYPHCTKGRIGAVGVDYLQMVKNRMAGRTREQEVSETSRTLKRQAKAFGVPYLVVSPLNRAPEQRPNARPRLSDLRESGAIEYDADVVLFVHRPEMYVKDDPALKGWAEIIIAKQRNGPTGSVRLAYKGIYTAFDNIAYREGYDEYDDFPEQSDAPEEWSDRRFGD